MRIILGSRSASRNKLLQLLGVDYEVIPADIDETPFKKEAPRLLSARLAKAKAERILQLMACEQAVVITADTVAAVGRRILPSAATDEEVRMCLKLISGRR